MLAEQSNKRKRMSEPAFVRNPASESEPAAARNPDIQSEFMVL
jgi:hypothetical protein